MRIMSIAVAAACLLPMGSAFSQQPGSGTSGQMRSALLVPAGFQFEGNCTDSSFFGGQMIFSEQGDKMFVNIAGTAGSCNSAVELSGDKIQFKGCGGAVNSAVYDPSNARQPFKGRAGGYCTFDMKPR